MWAISKSSCEVQRLIKCVIKLSLTAVTQRSRKRTTLTYTCPHRSIAARALTHGSP
ncbi:unnamed protein product [Spirodela intermedia]|uniref:Uncharacterized protein n=1 Tax=Spirodela intermedia TaxID=51605 RepID=A0ABN7EBE5_SPIIN|nr:unnamed protein product [Spirodela intermedia]